VSVKQPKVNKRVTEGEGSSTLSGNRKKREVKTPIDEIENNEKCPVLSQNGIPLERW